MLGGAHNLPFDYNKAREEFLNNSIRESQKVNLASTTEQPGDDWTTADPNNLSTNLVDPQSTLSVLTTSTTELVLTPDGTLSTIKAFTSSPEAEVGLQTTTKFDASDVLLTWQPKTTTADDNMLIDMITIQTPPTTSALPIVTGRGIRVNETYNSMTQIGSETSSAESVDMACKRRDEMPMLQVLCDLAKSVYRPNT